MNILRLLLGCLGAAGTVIAALGVQTAAADSVEDFYKGKTITLYVGFSPGGGYDTYARTVARHMGRHIPGNPGFVVKNRPGAGTLVLTNELYNVLPKDGTAMGVIARGTAMEPLMGNKKAKFDPRKFNWIGSANNEVSICVAWHTVPVKNIQDLRTRGLVVGGTGPGADTDAFPKLMNNILGAKLKLITGYPGGTDINLAMERGEVEGRCGWSWSSAKSRKPEWIKNNKIRVLAQMSLEKHPDMPDVPLIMDFTDDPDDKKALEVIFARQVMGRPFVAPPGVPADRVKALRDAFMAVMNDPAYLADANKQKLETGAAVSGRNVAKLVDGIYDSSERAIALAQDAVTSEKKIQITKKEIPVVTVSTTITDIKKGGRELHFQVKGKSHKTKVSGSRTKITIAGKEGKRKNIKVGMVCDVSYQGNGTEAKNIACK
jgi:tripartite-type tricarboxylate transporter receptor subunit TctC